MKDTLTIATAEGVRIYAITTKNLVQEAADRHHTSHLATAALGRAMSGALAYLCHYNQKSGAGSC